MNCPIEFDSKTTVHPGWLIVAGVFIMVMVSLLAAAVLGHFLPGKEWEDVYVFVVNFVMALCLFYFIRKIGINILAVLQDWWKNKTEHLRIVFKYFLVYAGLTAIVVSGITVAVVLLDEAGIISLPTTMALFENTDPNDMMARLKFMLVNSTPRFTLSLVTMCVLAPVIEEVFFRRFLFVALRKKMNFAPALIISSALFIVMHPNMVSGALGGFYLGYVYEKRKSLPANILLHSLVNLFVIITDVLF